MQGRLFNFFVAATVVKKLSILVLQWESPCYGSFLNSRLPQLDFFISFSVCRYWVVLALLYVMSSIPSQQHLRFNTPQHVPYRPPPPNNLYQRQPSPLDNNAPYQNHPLNRSSPDQHIPMDPTPPRGVSKFSRSKVCFVWIFEGTRKNAQQMCLMYSLCAMSNSHKATWFLTAQCRINYYETWNIPQEKSSPICDILL